MSDKGKILSFEDFEKQILSKRSHTQKKIMLFRLETMKGYLCLLDSPQKNMRFIHIAGTNGKGSTASFIKAGLQSLGYLVGLYTSPHLIDLRERWQLNDKLISKERIFSLSQKIIDLEYQYIDKDKRATVFEFFTLLAILYFFEEKADFVILETGLGGRLDATNIVTPIISLITYIGLDHQNILGESLEEIALEKAGIIKQGIPCITTEENENIEQILCHYAKNKNSPYFALNKDFSFKKDGDDKMIFSMNNQNLSLSLSLLGDFQYKNLSLSLACLYILKKYAYIESLPSPQSFKKVQWRGRLEYLSNGALVDCAHNIDGVNHLLSFLKRGKKYHFFNSFLIDKNWQEMLNALLPYAQSISLLQMDGERALDMNEILEYLRGQLNISVKIVSSIEEFEKLSYPMEKTIVCGSFILVGKFLAYFS